MSDHARLVVFFHSSRDVPGDVLVEALEKVPGWGQVRVTQQNPKLTILWDDDWEILVWQEKGARVVKQAHGIAAREGTDPSIQQKLALCDRRFVVSYEPDVDMKYFNTWLFTADTLADLVDGVIYDPHARWLHPNSPQEESPA